LVASANGLESLVEHGVLRATRMTSSKAICARLEGRRRGNMKKKGGKSAPRPGRCLSKNFYVRRIQNRRRQSSTQSKSIKSSLRSAKREKLASLEKGGIIREYRTAGDVKKGMKLPPIAIGEGGEISRNEAKEETWGGV